MVFGTFDYLQTITNNKKQHSLDTVSATTIWKGYAESRGFVFETKNRNIPLAGKKTELIIRANDRLTIRGVFQLDITGWGQGKGPLNKTTVQIILHGRIELADDKMMRKKFGYKRCSADSDTLLIEYNFLFESMNSFELMEELLLEHNIII